MISKNEYAPYYEQYIQFYATNGKSIVDNLLDSQKEFDECLKDLPLEKHKYSYNIGKWTVKEVIQHIIDTERVFCYRALSFARNDQTPLAGYDQDVFVANDNANERNLNDMLTEMQTLRTSTIQLFQSFSDAILLRVGNASGNTMSVRAIGYVLSGHQTHHLQVLKERYF